ncbi:MAG: CU044_5270 family protein [Angustibacter sp.]
MSDLDVIESVQRFRAHVPEPDDDRVRRAGAVFRTSLAQADAGPAPARWSWRVRIPAVAGAAALGAALVLGVTTVLPGGPGVDSAAAATLNATATATARQPDMPQLRTGQYWYERATFRQEAYLDQPAVQGVHETWIAPDGSGRIGDGSDEVDRYGPGGLSFGTNLASTYPELLALPRDTDQLYEAVERATRTMQADGGNTRPGEAQMLAIVCDVLSNPGVPSDLRAALYRVAARIPGVDIVEGATDGLGRTGSAIRTVEEDTGIARQLVFDPATGEVLATRQVSDDGVVYYEDAITQRAIVDSIDDRP